MGNGFVARLVDRRDATALVIRDGMVSHVRAYGLLAPARQRELLDEVHDTWTPALQRAATDDPLSESDLDVYRELGRRRAVTGFALDDMRAGFEVAFGFALREALGAMQPNDREEPLAFTAWGVRQQPRVTAAASDAYVAARGALGDPDRVRELLVECLLSGRCGRTAAAALGIRLPAGYLVLLCRRRLLEEVTFGLDRAAKRAIEAVPGALWRQDVPEGTLLVLLPVEENVGVVRAVAADLTTTLAEILGQRLRVAEAYGPTLEAVPAAVEEVRQTVALVAAMPDATSRPYRAEELLVALAVARQPDIRRRLADLLAPLLPATDLRRTLEAFFDCDLDWDRTTKALYVHRRTLVYRLERIRELTGLDPTTAHGIQLLRTALTAARLSCAR